MKHRKLTRILSALLVLTTLLAVAPQLTLPANAAETSGKCGEKLSWSFDSSSGTLTISGYGSMDDFVDYDKYDDDGNFLRHVSSIPWNDYTEQIIDVRLPDRLTSIGAYAFFNCANLRSINIPDGVTEIGESAFQGCSHLQEIVIPEGVTTIGYFTFYECSSLQSVTIPRSVTEIESDAFANCVSLRNVTIPDGVQTIGFSAFADCVNLQSVSIPASVKMIHTGAFYRCRRLENISFPDGLESVTIEYDAFKNTAFINNPDNWENGLLYLSDWLLAADQDITSADIRPGTVGIADNAFSDAYQLTSVTFPESLESIGSFTFFRCIQLAGVSIPDSVRQIGSAAFRGTALYNDPSSWSTGLLYADNWLVEADQEITEAIVRPGTQGIADDAFFFCSELTDVSLPEGLRFIGQSAFSNCEKISQIDIPKSITEIRDRTFISCRNLIQIVIPKNVTRIGAYAFWWNDNLKNIQIQNKDCVLNDHAIGYCFDCTIYGYPGSTAEAFAKYAGFPFEVIEEINFVDVNDAAYYSGPVAWAVENGITNGTSKRLFSPDSTCTRAQVVTFLWRAAGEPEPSGAKNPFVDVKPNDYYYKAVLWAVEKGITTGTSSDKFSPNAGCTRGQVVTFLWRAEGKPAPENTVNPFKDVDAREYYGTAVAWAVEKGITRGTSADKFSPASTCTRAQVMTFLYRTEHPSKNKCKVGIVLAGDENEAYSYAHIHGIETAMEKLGIDKNAEAVWKYCISEDESCYDAIADCIAQGCNIVFTNAYGHQSFAKQQAEENPNVQIVALTGDFAKAAKLPNFHNASTEIYEARYAAGVVAGMKIAELDEAGKLTDANYAKDGTVKVGYVGAYPYAEVVSGYTAFFLGIKSVYENVSMEVLYTKSWFDIIAEKEAAEKLIADGCVIIGQHSDSSGAPIACEAALKAGTTVYSVGYNVDMLNIAPTAALTSPTNNWEAYYEYALSAMLKGVPIVTDWAEGFDKDAVALTRLGSSVASGTREAVDKVIADLKAGKLHVFDTGTFTVGSAPVTSAFATDTNGDFVYDADEAIFDGYYHECFFRSAPSFSLRIDGITELN